MRQIARDYGVSETYVRKLCKPEMFEKKYKPDPEKAREYMVKHRQYKKQLKEAGKI